MQLSLAAIVRGTVIFTMPLMNTSFFRDKPQPLPRSAFAVFRDIPTRWSDNDIYGHVNNVVYYSWFDTAVNSYLIEQGVLDIHSGSTIGLVVQTQCNYFAPLAFPQMVQAGLRVARLGNSSVHYEIGLFAQEQPLSAAWGHFVHVYVQRQDQRPCTLPAPLRQVLEGLCVDGMAKRVIA